MGSIGDWGAGATPNKGNPLYYGGNILWLRTGELNDSYIYDTQIKVTDKALKECSLRYNNIGDVLIAMYGATIGKVAIAGVELTTNQACCACTPILLYNKYLFYFLMSNKDEFCKKGEGGAQPNISREKLISHLIPIPPLKEQYRIVEQIDSVLPHIGKLELLRSSLQIQNNTIQSRLKKSILQEAIQGKLVPQIESEGTAEELLEEIRAEKKRLVKEGKLKASALKGESRIFKGEDNKYYEQIGSQILDISELIPFDLPISWIWARGKTIFMPMESTKPTKAFTYIDIEAVNNSLNVIDRPKQIELEKAPSRATRKLHQNDILFSMVRPYLRNIALVTKQFENAIASTGFYVIKPSYGLNPNYLFYLMLSNYVIDGLNSFMKGENSPSINNCHIENFLFPIPPIKEQQRIAERLKKILEMI